MKMLWLNAGLLLPLDKGGKLRTWHVMRHLAARHDITYLSFCGSGADRRRIATGMREVCARPRDRAAHRCRRRARWRFYADAARYLVDARAVRGREVPLRRLSRRASSALLATRRFDAVVCDFLPPVVNLPRAAALPGDPLHAQRRGGDLAAARGERRPTRSSRVPAGAAVAADAALRARRAGALRPGAGGVGGRPRDVRAALPGRAARAGARRPDRRRNDLLRAVATDAAERARTWSSPARWTGCRTKTACTYFCREILPRIRQVGAGGHAQHHRPRADAGRQAARRDPRRRGHRPRRRRAAAHRARAPSTSCRCASAAARG